MNIVLLHPPETDALAPMLALPSLTAFLRENGYQVIQKDVNTEIQDYFCNSGPLEEIRQRSSSRFQALDSKRILDWKQQNEYSKYLSDTYVKLPYYIENIANIKKRVRTIGQYSFKVSEEPILAKDWVAIDEIKNIIFEPVRRYIPFKVRELSTKILFHTIEQREELHYYDYLMNVTIPDIQKQNPSLIGLSITFPDQVISALLLAYLLKQSLPDVHLTVGGSHFSLLQTELMQFSELFGFIDSFVIGEGEYALLELARCIEQDKPLDTVPNLIYKKNGKITRSQHQPIVDFNALPCPDFTGLPLDKYFIGKLTLPYAFSRGCHYAKCTFCNFHLHSFRYRIKKPERVVADLRKISKKHNTGLFYFAHEADPVTRMKQIFSQICESDLDLKYFTFCRFDRHFDEELANLLVKSGCRKLYFGLESANERVNALINKGIDLELSKEILKKCSKVNLPTTVSSIMCFPTESQEERMDTNRYYDEIFRDNELCTGGSHVFRLAKGSPVEQNYQQFGIGRVFYESSGNLHTVFSFKQKNDEVTPKSKMQARADLAKTIRQYSRFSDYSYLQFAENSFEDFVKWTQYVRKAGLQDSSSNGNGVISKNGLDFTRQNFCLGDSVEVKKINFPLQIIKKAVNNRTIIVYDLFFNEGHPMSLIEETYLTDEQSVHSEPYLFLYETKNGTHILFHQNGETLIDLLNERRTVADLVQRLSSICDTNASSIRSSVEKTLTLFAKKGFIESSTNGINQSDKTYLAARV